MVYIVKNFLAQESDYHKHKFIRSLRDNKCNSTVCCKAFLAFQFFWFLCNSTTTVIVYLLNNSVSHFTKIFRLFFNDEICALILCETERYASQQNDAIHFTRQDIETFIKNFC